MPDLVFTQSVLRSAEWRPKEKLGQGRESKREYTARILEKEEVLKEEQSVGEGQLTGALSLAESGTP